MQIYILNRARETLATTASIYDDKHTMTLEAGSSSYEFTIDKSDSASKSLETGNYIVLQDDNGKTWLFTILDYEETHNTKTVYAEDAGIELINKAMDIWTLNGSHPFKYYFDLVTKDTPWTLGVNRLEGLSRSLKFDGRDTGLRRLLSILKAFDHAECSFDVTVKMNAPADFKINVYKQIGNDRSDVQIVYNSELDDIKKKESRAEFVTALAGVGGQIQSKDGTSEGNVDFSALEYNKDGFVTKKGDKFLRAVDANKVFNPGHESYIESFYEYDTQSPSELLSRTLSKLKIYSEPQYTYNAEVKVIDPSLNLGDTVTILDHDYNPALYLSARVAKMVKSYTDPTRNEIEFTNYRLLSSRLADKLARLQTIVNQMPSASQVGKLESNVSALSSKTDELASQITSANGKNTNYYGKTEPANPKNGDLWYKKLESGEIEMYQYQDGTWQLLASTADLTTVQTELDQAKADMEQAKTDAKTAYDEAIKATGTANGAKAQTDEALKQARQAKDSYTTLAKEVADNKASVDADYKRVSDDYTALAKEVAGNKASADADYQKAQADITQAQKDLASVTDTVTEVKKGQGELSAKVAGKVDNTVYQTYVKQTNQALSEKLVASDLNGYAKTVDVTKSIDGVKTTIADNTGKITQLTTDVSGVKSTVKSAQGDISALQTDAKGVKATVSSNTGKIAQLVTDVNGVKTTVGNVQGNVATLQTDAKSIKATVADNKGKISIVQTDVNGIKTNVKNAQGDISTLQTDAKSIKATVASNAGKITQLTTDVNGVKSSVSSKVDKTTYQSYVAQTDKALSAKLTASDLNGYAKTADVKQTTDGLSASITKVKGDLSSLQIGGANLLDDTAGPWKKAGIGKNYTDVKIWTLNAQLQSATITVSFDCRASTSKSFYCFFFGNDYNANGKVTSACNSQGWVNNSIGVDGMVPIKPSTVWGRVWIRYNLSKIPPAGTKRMLIGRLFSEYATNDWLEIRNVKLESGNKATDWCKSDNDFQSQLTTLSGKITATSDRLSSVYTKSETDAKLKTKVEQSTLTQTSNNLSASIAKNSKILSSAGLVNENAYINANKIALNGKTLMTNATINDAFIGSLSANKITTGTLNAARVNLINVNASNISTGVLNGIKITSTGKDPSGTSSTTKIESGYIDTNVINCSDYIMVGKADADPRKRWQTKQTPQGMWFQTPAKITGHTGNAVSDWQTEWQGFMGGDGWNYRNATVTGTGYSGIQLALTPQQEWGNPYGGDMMSFGTWIRTETSNKTKNILDGTLDPFLWYSYTGQSAAYKDTVVIPKPLRVFGETHFDWDIHVKGGGSHGIRTAWVSWSDWGSNQKVPCIVQDKDNWGGIAFPANGRVVLFTHDYRVNTDSLPRDKGGRYNGWGS